MNDDALSGLPMPDHETDRARRLLSDDIRSSLWPYVGAVRRQVSGWITAHSSPVDLVPLPTRQLSLGEKCAVLAAFHDSVDEGEPFISFPIRSPESPITPEEIEQQKWWVLVGTSRKVAPRPNDPLRTLLGEVVGALAAAILPSETPPPYTSDSSHVDPSAVSVANSELERIADGLRSLPASQRLSIGLFKWMQECTGRANDRAIGISLADVAAALEGEKYNIVYWGAVTWRDAQPLRDDDGNEIRTHAIDPSGAPIVVDGAPLETPKLGSTEYRGVVVLDHDFQVDESSVLDEMKRGGSQSTECQLVRLLNSAGLALGKLRHANDAIWGGSQLSALLEIGAGPIVRWVCALYELQRRGIFTGDFVDEFWHWRVEGPGLVSAAKPGTDVADFDTTRYRAVVREPIAASLQLIDYLLSHQTTQTAVQPYTIGQLISDQSSWEASDRRAKDAYGKIKRAIEKGSIEAHYLRVSQDHRAAANRMLERYMGQPGVRRLRTICDAEGGDWSAKWLRQKCAELCLREGLDESAIEALPVPEFAQKPHVAHSVQRTLAAIERTTTDNVGNSTAGGNHGENRSQRCLDEFADAYAEQSSPHLFILAFKTQNDGSAHSARLTEWPGGSLCGLGNLSLADGDRQRNYVLMLFQRPGTNPDFEPWLRLARKSGAALLADPRMQGIERADSPASDWASHVVRTLWSTEWKRPTADANVFQFAAFAASIETWKRLIHQSASTTSASFPRSNIIAEAGSDSPAEHEEPKKEAEFKYRRDGDGFLH